MQIVVGKTVEKIVMDTNKDVLLEVRKNESRAGLNICELGGEWSLTAPQLLLGRRVSDVCSVSASVECVICSVSSSVECVICSVSSSVKSVSSVLCPPRSRVCYLFCVLLGQTCLFWLLSSWRGSGGCT